MKKLILILAIFCFNITFINAQTPEEMKVSEAVGILRKVMIDPDKAVLERIVHEDLSYGHSSGSIETKAVFIESLTSNNSDFKTIDLTEQTIKVIGKTAIVRHKLFAETANKGVPSTAKLNILLIFTKVKGEWKLLARQAAKIV
ncbi:MAG: nuclear transport factor 2 family protein [Arcicella sp.]|nr:nuclear transport factor 2 family protein [Arcicella sp.]